MKSKPVFEIDGRNFANLEGFFREFRAKLGIEHPHTSLDAFNDVLRGGFGTPDGGFVLRWLNSNYSRHALGYPETLRYLEEKVRRCHRTNVPLVEAEIDAARRGEGKTLFDVVVDIISVHGTGGEEAKDGVELELK